MVQGEAVSYESLCAFGRVFTVRLFLVDKGALAMLRRSFGSPPAPRRNGRSNPRKPLGVDPLKFFLAGDVLDSDHPLCVRVRNYSYLDSATVFAGSRNGLLADTVPVEWEAQEAAPFPGAYVASWELGTSSTRSGMQVFPPHEDRPWAHEFGAHESVGTSYFVTTDSELLDARNSHNMFVDKGIVSPAEMVRIAELALMDSGQVHVSLEETYKETIDTHSSYYTALASSLLPNTYKLLRSSWNPDHRNAALARHCHEIVDRLVHLLRARDELARLALDEGWNRSGNGLRDRSVYHAQVAVTLTSSLLDSVILAVAELCQYRKRDKVSWSKAVLAPAGSTPGWVRAIDAGSDAGRMLAAARGSSFAPVSRLVNDLRDVIAHRGTLESADGVWRASDFPKGEISKGVLVVPADSKPVADLPGLYEMEDTRVLVPHVFVDGMLRGLADCVETVLAIPPTPGHQWWEHDAKVKQAAWDDQQLGERLRQLSGW